MSLNQSEIQEEVSETLHLAETYISKLNGLKKQLEALELQVTSTYQNTKENIEKSFSDLRLFVLNVIDKREKQLIHTAEEIKCKGLEPLKQCSKVISECIETTSSLITEGSHVQLNNPDKVNKFLDKATNLGNLPAIPYYKTVPYICFYCEPIIKEDIGNYCQNFGEVFSTAPIQIERVDSKPGSLLVKWAKSYNIDNEYKNPEITEFKLERAFGDVTKSQNSPVNFIECYRGHENQFLMRDMQISQPYTFRICCKFSGASEWTPWSFPHAGMTTIPPLSWKPMESVILSNDNKIMTLSPNCDGKSLIARSAEEVVMSDSEENCVEFTVLEADLKSTLLLGLSVADDLSSTETDNDLLKTSFLVDGEGKIFINGSEKRTVLPKLTRGTKISFCNRILKDDKIKVTVDCKDKSVTYYWDSNGITGYSFVCHLKSSKWKVMVE